MSRFSIIQRIELSVGLLLLLVLVAISSFPTAAQAVVVGASINFQSSNPPATFPTAVAIPMKVLRGSYLPTTGPVQVVLTSSTGGEFSTGNLSGGCTGSFGPGPSNVANIASGTTQKAFCYRNSNPGVDIITAVLTHGDI